MSDTRPPPVRPSVRLQVGFIPFHGVAARSPSQSPRCHLMEFPAGDRSTEPMIEGAPVSEDHRAAAPGGGRVSDIYPYLYLTLNLNILTLMSMSMSIHSFISPQNGSKKTE